MARARKRRPYNARRRRERAEATRATILDVARRELLTHGYAATTIAAIAEAAGVSVETIYKSFGGKPGLVGALWKASLKGSGAVAAPRRADAIASQATDPRDIVRAWGKLASEVSPLVSPILLLVRDAAASDPEIAKLQERADRQRLMRMRHNAQSLAARGFLRPGLSIKRAADIMWMSVSPEIYELLVVRRGWTSQELGQLVTSTLASLLTLGL